MSNDKSNGYYKFPIICLNNLDIFFNVHVSTYNTLNGIREPIIWAFEIAEEKSDFKTDKRFIWVLVKYQLKL